MSQVARSALSIRIGPYGTNHREFPDPELNVRDDSVGVYPVSGSESRAVCVPASPSDPILQTRGVHLSSPDEDSLQFTPCSPSSPPPPCGPPFQGDGGGKELPPHVPLQWPGLVPEGGANLALLAAFSPSPGRFPFLTEEGVFDALTNSAIAGGWSDRRAPNEGCV